MKIKKYRSMLAIGGGSLLVIFGALCFVVFSLLSLNTVLAEKHVSESSAQKVNEWHVADRQAQDIFSRLRTGEQVPGVEQKGTNYSYSVPISDNQTLEVELKETDGRWEILSWQTVTHPEDGEASVPVGQDAEEEG